MRKGLRLLKKLPFNSLMFLVFITIGIIAYMKPGRFINELFIIISIILALDGIYFFLLTPYLKVRIYTLKTIQKNERFTFKIDIINTAHLPSPYIYIKPKEGIRAILEKKQTMVVMLEAKKYREQDIYCKAQFCGKEEAVLDEVSMRSFIGFFRRSITLNVSTTIKILPEIRHLEYMQYFNAFLTLLNIGGEKQNEQGDSDTIGDEVGYELSPYVEGDSQRLIHWKIAAFRDEYLVRQREGRKEQRRELFFILSPFIEWQSNDEEAVIQDKIVTTLMSLVAYYLNEGQKVRVTYYKDKGWRYVKIREPKDIYFLQEILSDYEGIRLEQGFDQCGIIKSLLKLTEKKIGIKVIISSYWEEGLEKCVLESKFQTRMIPIIWTCSDTPDHLTQKSLFPFWHMTDDYRLVLCTEEKLEMVRVIDEM